MKQVFQFRTQFCVVGLWMSELLMIYLTIFFLTLIAFCISAVAGGGAGLLLIPVLAQVLDPMQVPVALTVGTASSSITRIIAFYRYIDWSIVRWVVLASLPGVMAGAYLLTLLDPSYVEFFLSLFLISNLVLLFRREQHAETRKIRPVVLVIIGFLIGLVSSLTGAVGVLFNRVYFRYGLDAKAIIATRAANEVVVHLVKLLMYTALGLLTLRALTLGLLIAAAAILSVILVKAHVHRLPQRLFVKLGYAAMVVSGVIMLNTTVLDIIDHHQPHLKTLASTEGGDIKLSWDDILYSLEFRFEHGLAFEKSIELATLTPYQQSNVVHQCHGSDHILLEAVYSFSFREYEIHCLDENNIQTRKVVVERI